MTIREALSHSKPHVAIKAALKALVQGSRRLKKRGQTMVVGGRADLDRFLSAELPSDFSATRFKEDLWTLLNLSLIHI